ncbi:hypothetical protein M885DRAFT_552270 [Pelagophyceae sp. CCMP2097]|nr:hypothetical protein M885DRAFT_552270 [Pelagophyceae sp. CCMP2097]
MVILSTTRSALAAVRGVAAGRANGGGVVLALQRLREDIDQLDVLAGSKPRLTIAEGVLLFGSVVISGLSPGLAPEKVLEVLIPSLALLVASIGVSAEYGGRVATANAKEVAAKCLQSTAEAEALLATAERSKAVIPFVVGVAAMLSAISLLFPALVLRVGPGNRVVQQSALICPVLAIIATSVAALAEEQTTLWARGARDVGRRRFSDARNVGASWLSQTEMVFAKAESEKKRWAGFVAAAAFGPLVALLCRGPLAYRAIVATTATAAQAGYYLASAEYAVAIATDAVAIKSRTAAVADTYANQAARIGAVLPFTSALAGLFAAGATVVVELQPTVSAGFPLLGALCATAASVSKACCEADASATFAAADQLGGMYKNGDDSPPTLAGFMRKAVRIAAETARNRVRQFFTRLRERLEARADPAAPAGM